MGTSLRLFVAIDLPTETKEELSARKILIKQEGFRYTKTENLHITLYFIGNTLEEDLNEISNKLAAVKKSGAFTLKFDKVKAIKRKRQFSMLWAAFKENSFFSDLANDISKALTGKPADKATPHITLARAGKRAPINVDEITLPDLKHLQLNVNRFGLWKSELKPSGPEYILLKEFVL